MPDKILTEREYYDNYLVTAKERIKELNCINETAAVVNEDKSLEETLQRICELIPRAWQYPEHTVVRIIFDKNEFVSTGFNETRWIQKAIIKTFDGRQGSIDVFYTRQSEKADEGPFLNEERDLLESLATIVTGYLNKIIARQSLTSTENSISHIIANDERIRTIEGIENIEQLLLEHGSIDELLKSISLNLPKVLQYPKHTAACITFDGKKYQNHSLKTSLIKKTFKEKFAAVDGTPGSVEFHYLEGIPLELNEDFLAPEHELLLHMTQMITGIVNFNIESAEFSSRDHEIKRILKENIDRRKQLQCINKTITILQETNGTAAGLTKICKILPNAFHDPSNIAVRITYGDFSATNDNFIITYMGKKKSFKTADGITGSIEMYSISEISDEDPFLKEDINLLNNMAAIISGWLNMKISYVAPGEEGKRITDLLHERKERMKELACLNQTSEILRSNKSPDENLQQIVHILPNAWQFPEFTIARIRYDDKEFLSPNFKTTPWVMKQYFHTIDDREGTVEIYYTTRFPKLDEGPFLKEERDLINNLASMICGYLDSMSAKETISEKRQVDELKKKYEDTKETLLSKRKLLHDFLNKNNYDRDVFHDLMTFKVGEILLIANLYDAYSIEREGRFSDYLLGDYYQLNLTYAPRITGVSSYEEAFEKIYSKHFDMVIVMVGSDKTAPLDICRKIKHEFNYLPVFLLLNNNSYASYFEAQKQISGLFDNVFIWNGDSTIFFTMVKLLEDQINLENDTQVGYSRVILLVEDSARYYSRFLPFIFRSVMEQTRRIIEDVSSLDELYKILRLRVRPKVLLVSSYEEALNIFEKYKDYLLGLITDVKFFKNNKIDSSAGLELVKKVKKETKSLPVVLMSSESENREHAHALNCQFIDKNSETLVQDIRSFISDNLGFGDFIYKDAEGKDIAIARSLKDFLENLKTIPIETLLYHARKNHFSLWLTARGEMNLAKRISAKTSEDFDDPQQLRNDIINIIEEHRFERNKGKIIEFDETFLTNESSIISLSPGAHGGKGRGLAFIHTLIYNFDITSHLPHINLKAPRTFFIGTEEFELFLENNKLRSIIHKEKDHNKIKKLFAEGELTGSLTDKLRLILESVKTPLAIRSSGLFEDSLMQPFAGIFETYILPNNNDDIEIRLKNLTDAIKLVFASVFSDKSRGYASALNLKIEEEKMAVIIQELVGNRYGNYFYPHMSGVAQSYNFYSFGNMEPEDGYAVLAIGLGSYVVEGEKAYRFSPKYPTAINYTPKDLIQNSQVHFYAVNLNNTNPDLLASEGAAMGKLFLEDAEMHGTLRHCASVYNPDNDAIIPGIDKAGPRIVNFANILKYNYIPLAEVIQEILDIVREAMGTPIEIEFAVDLNKDKDNKASLYLLQIKPLFGSKNDYEIDPEEIDKDKLLLYAKNGMGNGYLDTIEDVVFVDINNFDKSKTPEIAAEIAEINESLKRKNKHYILIGPGRWGTRDRWIGIPVTWPQISNAKIIVETSLEGYPLDGSAGSHFFHNVTSMNVGYFAMQHTDHDTVLNFDVLNQQNLIQKTNYVKHVRFKKNLVIRMDGKKRISAITWQQ
jgi:CheY-like chemotaxis protein